MASTELRLRPSVCESQFMAELSMTAVIAFDFDPYLRLGDGVVRWETLGIAAAIFVALILAAIGARTMELRTDDLLFVVLGVVPGAVIGGRLGYVLLHPAFFAAQPVATLDPSVGSLELGLAVVGGALTGGIVAALLDGAVGRWFHIAALPVLVVIGLGKLATVLGGRGQGVPSDAPWATAYAGPGPWGSLAPEVPSVPAQALEGLATLGVLVLVMGVLAVPGLRRPDGRAFLEAVGLWALTRAIVASTWRDPVVAGPFRMEQVIDLVILAGCIAGIVVLVLRERPAPQETATG
jgi:phosphatidylglycerol---prolipoprotein diacylglyceryl transferase